MRGSGCGRLGFERYQAMISPRLYTQLADRYGIAVIYNVAVLAGGEWKRLLRLETDRGLLVLSVSHPTTVVAGMDFEHDLLGYMSRLVSEVPAPLMGRDGTTYFLLDGRVATLFPFMPGTMANDELEAVRLETARMLARLHQAFLNHPAPLARPGICALCDLDWNYNQWWDWHEVSLLLSDTSEPQSAVRRFWEDGLPFTVDIMKRRSQIEREKETLSHWLKALTASGRSLLFAPTHGDYYARNLLMQGNRVSAVLDWDECRPDWLSFELARATLNLCSGDAGGLRQGKTIECFRAKANSFLRAYQDAGGPVPPGEFDLLVPFMRCVCLIDTIFAFAACLRGEEWNPAHAEYHLNNLITLENLEDVQLFD